jgi:hypothetical protein
MLSNPFEIQEEKSLFQVIFLKNDIHKSVSIEEVKEINFEEIEEHLLNGHSVFITRKEEQKMKAFLK